MREFLYSARFSPDKKDGGYVVTLRDIPEAITQGETVENVWRKQRERFKRRSKDES